MIRIGNQTSCWAPSPAEPFNYAVANGFDAFEWFPDKKLGVGWDDSDLDPAQRLNIREAAKEREIRLSVHARWQANPLQPEAADLFQRDSQLARDLGAVLLNVHLYHEAGIERYISAITPLIWQTAELGLQLSIENTPEHTPEQFNELFGRMRDLRSGSTGHVGMCLDLGHANLSGATRNNYLVFVDRLDRDVPIIHLHLHENWGDADTHLTLFTGPAARDDSGIRAFVARMQKRNFSGSVIFEQWPQPPSLLNQARERLLGLLTPKEKPPTNRDMPLRESGAVGTPRPTSAVVVWRGWQAQLGLPTAPIDLAGAETRAFFHSLVEGDKRSRSWREKLDAVRELLVNKDSPLDEEELPYVAIYLTFLSAGQIACVEDGRHFRPAHHARISQEIQQRFAQASTPANAQLIRKIYAVLPSSAQAFQRAEPLTRIRDIAHRNDIPSELKREIKTTLQNKLHRCAGPEDLETSTKLLERITAPGANYSRDFVEQFQVFHEELKEFFNSRSLGERLNALIPEVKPERAELIRSFLMQKSKGGFDEQLATFKELTELRESFASDIEKQSNGNRQDLILSDIGLEDFSFVLLSQMLNSFEASEPKRSGADLLEPLRLSIRNIALSGISADECEAILAELNAWTANLDPNEREQLLRLKATVERCRRLAETYSEKVIGSLLSRAEELGQALGVADHAVRVFCEAEIRRHLIFQLSKLASTLLRRLRGALELPGCDVLVSGQAIGKVRVLDRLEDLSDNGSMPVIAVLKRAEGDEEIPKAVRGIVLAHEIPHLSHLGVRARQAGVVFVGVEDSTNLQSLQKLRDQTIRLDAAPDKVEWKPAQGIEIEQAGEHSAIHRGSPIKVSTIAVHDGDPLIVPIGRATAEMAGQKAFGLRKLTELSSDNENGFLVPVALVIPFGVMEKVLSSNKDLSGKYRALANELGAISTHKIEEATDHLRKLIEQLDVPDEITSPITRTFKPDDRMMVRSSANCEDLEDFAGAGLYESIPNVRPEEVRSVIPRIWSSLWTRRAVLSRNQAGISHVQAQMAVIVQQMIAPDYSFVLHTVNPLSHNADEVYAEIAVGLGETLASAASRGTPYRLVCNKRSGDVQTLTFANFSYALRPASKDGLTRGLIDYSRVSFSRESELRKDVGRRLAKLGSIVENEFGKAQDIEGAIMGKRIYLVQSRPQQGL
jgi:phosphoglucan,water dikinase